MLNKKLDVLIEDRETFSDDVNGKIP